MRILFCGTIVPESYDTKLRYLSPAGNSFQINFCKELMRQGNSVRFLSYIGFPIEGGLPDFKSEQVFSDGKVDYIYRKKNILESARLFTGLMTKYMKKADVLISYNAIHVWLIAPFLAKRKHIKSVLLLADYAEASSLQNHKMKWYAKLQLYSIRHYDVVIGLSVNTKRLLKDKQTFIRMEGGISKFVYDYFYEKGLQGKKVILMYSGLLEPVTGVDLLLEAFHKIKSCDIELWVSGKGSLTEMVQEYVSMDERIVNAGYLDYDQYLDRLRNAQILVNPRNMNLQENENNFPSKTMEYLATGKCIISTRFAGYERFKKYMFFCGSSAEDIKTAIETVIEDGIYKDQDIYLRNREFAKTFLWESQVQKLLSKI